MAVLPSLQTGFSSFHDSGHNSTFGNDTVFGDDAYPVTNSDFAKTAPVYFVRAVDYLQTAYDESKTRGKRVWMSRGFFDLLDPLSIVIDNGTALQIPDTIHETMWQPILFHLCSVCCDVIVDDVDEMLTDAPGVFLAAVKTVCGIMIRYTKSDADLAAVKSLLAKTSDLSDVILLHKERLLEIRIQDIKDDAGDNVDFPAIRLIERFITALTYLWLQKNCVPRWNSSSVLPLAFFCWFHQGSVESSVRLYGAIKIMLLGDTLADPHELQPLGTQLMCEYGAAPFVARFMRDLKDEKIVDEALQGLACVLITFVHAEGAIRDVHAQTELSRHIIVALRRQERLGSQRLDGQIWAALIPLVRIFILQDPALCAPPMILDDHIGTLLCHGVNLCAQVPPEDCDSDACRALVDALASLTVDAQVFDRRCLRKIYATLRRDVKQGWYSSFRILRDAIRARSIPSLPLNDLLGSWRMLGKVLDIEIAHERARTLCGWKGYEFYASPPPHRMQRCSRCKKVCYSDIVCQRDDWKEGGHKTSCVRVRKIGKRPQRVQYTILRM